MSCCTSHGAVVSHARRRTTTSPARTAWPGRSVKSRIWPVRLLSSRSPATRSAIGVVPGGSRVIICGTSIVSISASWPLFTAGAPVGLHAASAASAAHGIENRPWIIAQSGVQGW